MALKKQVVLSRIEVLPDGTLQVRLEKQVVDGEAVLGREYHRTVIEPGTDVDLQMGFVDEHLKAMGWPPVGPAVRARLTRLADAEHTPPVLAAFAKRLADTARDEARAAREAAKAG